MSQENPKLQDIRVWPKPKSSGLNQESARKKVPGFGSWYPDFHFPGTGFGSWVDDMLFNW